MEQFEDAENWLYVCAVQMQKPVASMVLRRIFFFLRVSALLISLITKAIFVFVVLDGRCQRGERVMEFRIHVFRAFFQ